MTDGRRPPGLAATSRLVGVALGANVPAPRLGPPAATLAWAAERLGRMLSGLSAAPLYRTAPISHLAQPDFLNTVILAERPPLPPRRLLGALKALEREAGRGHAERDAPRVLDLDLLFFGDLVLDEGPLPEEIPARPGEPPLLRSPRGALWQGPLTLPHPRLRARLFVLAPLRDLAPELALPPDGRTVAELYAAIAGSQEIERLPHGGAA